jgi:hypothetical protein
MANLSSPVTPRIQQAPRGFITSESLESTQNQQTPKGSITSESPGCGGDTVRRLSASLVFQIVVVVLSARRLIEDGEDRIFEDGDLEILE